MGKTNEPKLVAPSLSGVGTNELTRFVREEVNLEIGLAGRPGEVPGGPVPPNVFLSWNSNSRGPS